MSTYPVYAIEPAPAQSRRMLINGFIGLFERVHSNRLTEPRIQTLPLPHRRSRTSPAA
ncbi:hypothetical protein [Paraburkholderia pallida]|uniref:hypothetical protein n=1 Tax=Paraburkholderia pallida TaxID=2547399 RepID=UPI0026CD8CB9